MNIKNIKIEKDNNDEILALIMIKYLYKKNQISEEEFNEIIKVYKNRKFSLTL